MTEEDKSIEITESAGEELVARPIRDIEFGDDGTVISAAPDGGQIAKLQAEVKENYDKYLRSLAEFENFKKRTLKERSDLLKYQGERVFVDLLEIVDDFERALQTTEGSQDQFREGVELIAKRLSDLLGKWEVRGVSALGERFDPTVHNAISRVAAPGAPEGEVIGQLKKPYFYKDKLLRHGEVVVSAGDPAESGVGSDESN